MPSRCRIRRGTRDSKSPLSGLYWEVLGAGKTLRSRSLWDTTLPLPDDALSEGQTHYHQVTGPDGKLLLVAERLIAPLPAHGGRLRMVVASDLTGSARRVTPLPGTSRRASSCCRWCSRRPPGSSSASGCGRSCAYAMKWPRSQRANAVGLTESAPLEVRPLVAEVNALLEARDAEAARARGRAADLAHGLKTPLAALAGDVRRLRDGGQTEIACSIEASGETMRRHVERELARARMHRGHPVLAADSTSVSEVVDALFGILKRTDKGASLALVNDAPRSVRAPMERADLTEALGNVLDNAVRYAKTTVRVSCQGDSEPLAIVIEDDGPGIEQTLEAIIRQRGGRLDESGGAGLGLSLVQDILDAYRWRMDFGSSALGGVSLRLARAQ